MPSQGTVMPAPKYTAYDNSGNPLSGGKLYVYAAGTTTPATTYSDVDLTVANANPVVLDSGGRATVFLAPGSYKFIQKTSADVTVWTQDNISSVAPFNVDLDIVGTAGEDLAAGNVVFLSNGSGGLTAGRWYKADGDTDYKSSLPQIGMVPDAITTGMTGSIRMSGRIEVTGPLTPGGSYYVSNTAGALSSSAGTNTRKVGVADSTTTIVITPNPPPPTATAWQEVTLTDGATVNIDAALGVIGVIFKLTAAGNRTIAVPTNASGGQKLVIRHEASGADRTLTLTTGSSGAFRFSTDITGLTATTSGKSDYIGCIYDATDARWDVVAYSKGS